MDFYRTIAPFVLASLSALLAALAFRRWSGINSGLLTILVCAIITVVTTFVMLAIIPAGRKALYDVKDSSMLLFGKREGAVES
jgi:hypothetical protein